MCHALPQPSTNTSGVLTVDSALRTLTDPTELGLTQLLEFRVLPGVVPGVNGVPVRSVTLALSCYYASHSPISDSANFTSQERSRSRLACERGGRQENFPTRRDLRLLGCHARAELQVAALPRRSHTVGALTLGDTSPLRY